jgi:hypothetical protein
MNLDLSVRQMLQSYDDKMPEVDKLREILQQTALLVHLLANHETC